MRNVRVAFVAALLALSPFPTRAEPVHPEQPMHWEVKWDDAKCSLFRRAEGPDPTAFGVSLVPGSSILEIWLVNARSELPNGAFGLRFEVALPPDTAAPLRFDFMLMGAEHKPRLAARADTAFLDRLAAANAIRFTSGRSLYYEVPLPEAAKAVAALRECNDSVLRDWGVDPAFLGSLRQQPKQIGSVDPIDNLEYPREALRARISAGVLERLTVSADGRVTECVTVRSSGRADLDAKACEIWMRKGRFEPAIGPDGKPVRAMTIRPFLWSIH